MKWEGRRKSSNLDDRRGKSVRELQQQMSQTEANKLSVALELQADFYAEVWANKVRQYLTPKALKQVI